MNLFRKIGFFVFAFALLFVVFSCKTGSDDDNSNMLIYDHNTVPSDNNNTVSSGDNNTAPSGGDNVVPVADITLTFDTNSGAWSDGTTTKTISGKSNAAFTAPDTPIKKGYTFTGWNPALPEKIPQENTTYTATWTLAGNFIITYELNGGTNSAENPTGYNIETETFELKPATRIGYTFEGWYKDAEFNTSITHVEKGSMGNITLYAKWEEGYSATASDVVEVIKNLSGDATYKIKVTGEISSDIVKEIHDALIFIRDRSSSKETKIELDLSETTGLSSIDKYAPSGGSFIGGFGGCTNLISINVPDSVTSIDDYAFTNCTSLANVTIGDGLTSIKGFSGFDNCPSLENLTIKARTPPKLDRGDLFKGCGWIKIYVPADSVETYKKKWSEYARRIYPIQ